MKHISRILLASIALLFWACSKDSDSDNTPVVLSTENKILSFKLNLNDELRNGAIDAQTNAISFSSVGASLDGLVPEIEISAKATISPSATSPQDFSSPVQYRVTSESGEVRTYTVSVANRPLSSESAILSFTVMPSNDLYEATIDEDTHEIIIKTDGTGLGSVVPNIEISEYATISPAANVPQNFEQPVSYTVTAEDGTTTTYTVIGNPPLITGINGAYSGNPALFYTGAEFTITGEYLETLLPGAWVYFSDGNSAHELYITDSVDHLVDGVPVYTLTIKIPVFVPTGVYTLTFDANGRDTTSDILFDVLAENIPIISGLNQDTYALNDVLVLSGENLTDMIAIPSNLTNYLIENSVDYDLTVNPARTQLTLTLDYPNLFPSFYGLPPGYRTITLIGPDLRVGASIRTFFE